MCAGVARPVNSPTQERGPDALRSPRSDDCHPKLQQTWPTRPKRQLSNDDSIRERYKHQRVGALDRGLYAQVARVSIERQLRSYPTFFRRDRSEHIEDPFDVGLACSDHLMFARVLHPNQVNGAFRAIAWVRASLARFSP